MEKKVEELWAYVEQGLTRGMTFWLEQKVEALDDDDDEFPTVESRHAVVARLLERLQAERRRNPVAKPDVADAMESYLKKRLGIG